MKDHEECESLVQYILLLLTNNPNCEIGISWNPDIIAFRVELSSDDRYAVRHLAKMQLSANSDHLKRALEEMANQLHLITAKT